MPSLSFKPALLAVLLLFGLLQFGLMPSVQAAGSFYATQALQSQSPQAFPLQPEAQTCVLVSGQKPWISPIECPPADPMAGTNNYCSG
ncbi:hypothetical protein [Shewanella sp. GutDb-MelDb]|uniref:hypothetical protein n=1 Tax=Shewanella sp. GutDb-MelDb TaxID=2058316 RepID=UPI0011AEA263|nr:hypothetical protein [Shewanella sp. GutDb-MelDb]